MINKKSLWFLTLFSLILVLSVYYITMPNELLLTKDDVKTKETSVEIEENELLTTLRITSDEALEKEIATLKDILNDKNKTVEEKNNAFEKMQKINENKSLEKDIETKIEKNHKLKSFVKIENDDIEVVVNSKKHTNKLANQIMRTVQEEFDYAVNITVNFKK